MLDFNWKISSCTWCVLSLNLSDFLLVYFPGRTAAGTSLVSYSIQYAWALWCVSICAHKASFGFSSPDSCAGPCPFIYFHSHQIRWRRQVACLIFLQIISNCCTTQFVLFGFSLLIPPAPGSACLRAQTCSGASSSSWSFLCTVRDHGFSPNLFSRRSHSPRSWFWLRTASPRVEPSGCACPVLSVWYAFFGRFFRAAPASCVKNWFSWLFVVLGSYGLKLVYSWAAGSKSFRFSTLNRS
jgi:hypothetical protein